MSPRAPRPPHCPPNLATTDANNNPLADYEGADEDAEHDTCYPSPTIDVRVDPPTDLEDHDDSSEDGDISTGDAREGPLRHDNTSARTPPPDGDVSQQRSPTAVRPALPRPPPAARQHPPTHFVSRNDGAQSMSASPAFSPLAFAPYVRSPARARGSSTSDDDGATVPRAPAPPLPRLTEHGATLLV